jgi:predicted dehydrogenase
VRIGIVGTENSHADHYVRYFNTDNRYPDHRVVALAGGNSTRNRDLAAAGNITDIVVAPSDLIGLVDAAVVCSRDGRQHRAEATPFLEASLPVLVDKPLACDVPDARAMLDLAAGKGIAVTSFSALRYSAQTTDLADRLRSGPDVDTLVVTGPADPASEYAGIFFYGIHIVEIVLALLPGRSLSDLAVHSLEDAVVATASAGPTTVVMEFVRPDTRKTVPWRIVARRAGESIVDELRLDEHYTRPSVDVFAAMLDSGTGPLSRAELLAPVQILSTVAAGLAAEVSADA